MVLRLFLCCLLFSVALSGQSSVQQVVDRFAGTQVLENALVAVDVRLVDDGRQLASHNARVACIPASTQKLITTAAAMDILGSDYRFETRLIASGPIEDGILRGNLYIVGGGDPTLGSSRMDGAAELEEVVESWARAIRERGIRRITGAVIGDGSRYGSDGTGRGWPWADLGNYYGAGAYGLNLNENSYELTFTQRPDEGSTPPVLRVEPAVPGLKFTNELTSGPRGSGDQAYIFGAPFNYHHFIRGSIPAGTGSFRIRGSLPDPALLAAQMLNDRLEAVGIVVTGPPATHLTVGGYTVGEMLDEQLSPYLSEIVDRTNMNSVNLYAEGLLREMNKANGRPREELASTEVVMDWLESRGLDTRGVNLRDGSGLDPRNFFSPAFMTAFLVDQAGQERWVESIPLAGRSGSMRNVLRGTVAEGRVRGKSGTVNAVRTYAGYVDRPDGRRLAYSVAVNNHDLRTSVVNRLIYDLMRDLCTAGL
ncbi:D-alanyl-D-alanine carboxypeptidase/D-alanyl-D-alanine-endopeptidase (penicillin-binding protein 4) [Lewinella marina]|uniref:D-alanyl-D-alanine carboxypeptidase/D-alanyl-D-alanine-endopeptidase n=1 Tax=Neolewinella marina TaxID=438751 RepID=A0A2G0CEI5_9BACT|nr:D-alanyl-D-alanine carboxypeptidase/D-alanyl-D-alanine-endopeptidase [Neolewinella marina]NJB87308.1 D-alanyl-D-alanine carboxypeptidase/D-alanyl-D-alanine-endopeptidase (penicillin-binding protein 4) [Neolewinella marina]PHK98372.1 D-alanyl-D-alanine carboxypeptidase/D-alanyl-D-alanine-endopeptidase [Neolewinella marina]